MRSLGFMVLLGLAGAAARAADERVVHEVRRGRWTVEIRATDLRAPISPTRYRVLLARDGSPAIRAWAGKRRPRVLLNERGWLAIQPPGASHAELLRPPAARRERHDGLGLAPGSRLFADGLLSVGESGIRWIPATGEGLQLDDAVWIRRGPVENVQLLRLRDTLAVGSVQPDRGRGRKLGLHRFEIASGKKTYVGGGFGEQIRYGLLLFTDPELYVLLDGKLKKARFPDVDRIW